MSHQTSPVARSRRSTTEPCAWAWACDRFLRTMHRFPALLSAALLAPYHGRMRMSPPLLSAGRRAARRQRSSGRDDSVQAAVMPSPPPQDLLSGPRPTDVAGFVSLAGTHHQLGQPRKAYLLYGEAMQAGVSAAPVFAAVTRTLLKLQRVDLALELQRVHGEKQPPDVRSATALLGALCRKREWDEAAALVVLWEGAGGGEATGEATLLRQAVCRSMVPTLALSHLRQGDVAGAMPWLQRLPSDVTHTLTHTLALTLTLNPHPNPNPNPYPT